MLFLKYVDDIIVKFRTDGYALWLTYYLHKIALV